MLSVSDWDITNKCFNWVNQNLAFLSKKHEVAKKEFTSRDTHGSNSTAYGGCNYARPSTLPTVPHVHLSPKSGSFQVKLPLQRLNYR